MRGEPFPCSIVESSDTGGTLLCGTAMLSAEQLVWQLGGIKLVGFDPANPDKEIWSVPVNVEPVNASGLGVPRPGGERDAEAINEN